MRYEALPVATGDATCALIVALDVNQSRRRERPRPEKQPRTRSKSADVALAVRWGGWGLCLRAPVDAPKLEWIAPAFPKPGGPFGPAFLITAGKWPQSDESFIPISGEDFAKTKAGVTLVRGQANNQHDLPSRAHQRWLVRRCCGDERPSLFATQRQAIDDVKKRRARLTAKGQRSTVLVRGSVSAKGRNTR